MSISRAMSGQVRQPKRAEMMALFSGTAMSKVPSSSMDTTTS